MDSQEKDFVTHIIKSIVVHPDEVIVTQTIDELGVLLSINVNVEDMARVIGRQGQTAKSIRQLLRIIGFKNNKRINMKIIDPADVTQNA